MISRHVFKVQIMGQTMIYNRSNRRERFPPPIQSGGNYYAEGYGFGVYGKGVDGYVHYSLAMERIREEEESRKALMDEFDNDEDNFDSDDLDSDDFSSDDFGSDDFGGDDF